MNKRQKILQEQFLNNEEAVIRKLKNQYSHALKEIEKKAQALQDDINRLGTMAGLAVDETEKAAFLSMQQSKVYQKQYQDALKKQIGSILDNMQVEEFKTVSEYLQTCYEDGFIGTMYDLQGQGVPLCFPMDQEAMVRAIQLDSKISQGLYTRLGEDVSVLKKKITSQVSRGIATGMSYQMVAQQLAKVSNIGFNNAVRIARTEGHRVQTQSAMDACYKAKNKGADVLKQWCAILDARTRDSHVAIHNQVREIDEKFSNGLMYPGDPSGSAAEVINCRCALLQRARWALKEENLIVDEAAVADNVVAIKAEDYAEFKQEYKKAAEAVSQPPAEKPVQYKSFSSGEEANKALQADVDKWEAAITSTEAETIRFYTGEGYYDLNTYFRKTEGYEYIDGEFMKECAADLDSAIKKYKSSKNITVYRGCDVQAFGVADIKQLSVGGIFKDKGYMSTSVAKVDKVDEYGVLLEINVPKGKGLGAYINSCSRYADEEYEFLLKRGTQCKILEIDTSGEKPIIRMEVMK